MTILKCLGCFFLLAISFSSGICQELEKNKNVISVDYTFYQGDKFDGGDALARGVVIGYSRYFMERIYGDISYGLMNFEGKNSKWYLDPEEMSSINMRTFTLGLGYDLIQNGRFTLSGEMAYLYQSNEELLMILNTGTIIIRETGVTTDNALRTKLKASVSIDKNLKFITSYAHGFRFVKYSSNWLSLGLSYSF
jgi:hypothetical protein